MITKVKTILDGMKSFGYDVITDIDVIKSWSKDELDYIIVNWGESYLKNDRLAR